jgi:hypothetical protein
MFKRIAAVALMFGAALAVPAVGSAQEYRRDFDRSRSEYRDRDDRGRFDRNRERREHEYHERLERERRERFAANRYRNESRGFYDRAGSWHWY